MTTYVLAATANATLATAREMLEAGTLTAYTQRGNGTLRHLELAPLGSTRRDTAEWISERLEDGATVAQVAAELHVSKPTVRRMIMSLELTEEVEAGEWDQVWAEANELPYAEPIETASPEQLAQVFHRRADDPVVEDTADELTVLRVHL